MKKKILLVLLLVVAITLTGCGSSSGKPAAKDGESTTVCTLKNSSSQGTVDATYTIYYKGDYVTRVYSYEVVESDYSAVLESVKSQVESSYGAASKYGGYDYSVKISGNKLTSEATIDYEKMDMAKYIEDEPTLSLYTENNKFTLSGAKQLYTQMGANCE